METGNVDVVLGRVTAEECNTATERLARCLDTALPATEDLLTARELLAAFPNDLSNECLTRWGPQGQHHQSGRSSGPGSWAHGPEPPNAAGSCPAFEAVASG